MNRATSAGLKKLLPGPPIENPATTILPEDCSPTPNAGLKLSYALTSRLFHPPPPKPLSSEPSVLKRATAHEEFGEVALTTTALPSVCSTRSIPTSLDDPSAGAETPLSGQNRRTTRAVGVVRVAERVVAGDCDV